MTQVNAGEVTPSQAIGFVNEALRNIDVPPLGDADVRDIQRALQTFLQSRLSTPAVEDEREACARIAEEYTAGLEERDYDYPPIVTTAKAVAAAIRARISTTASDRDGLREALGEACSTLIYIFETSDDAQTSAAAKETYDKIDAALAGETGVLTRRDG